MGRDPSFPLFTPAGNLPVVLRKAMNKREWECRNGGTKAEREPMQLETGRGEAEAPARSVRQWYLIRGVVGRSMLDKLDS